MLMINFITKSDLILMYLKEDPLNLSSVKGPLIRSSRVSYQKYIEFQILVKSFFGIFVQKMGFVNSLNYSIIILGTDQNLDLLKMSQHHNTENVLDICLE